MNGDEFDPNDKKGSLRDKFDRYCKKTIYNAAHNLVYKQTRFLIYQYGADEVDPDWVIQDDNHDDQYAFRLSVRGREVKIQDEGLMKMLMKLQERKREILLMSFMLDMTLGEIAEELGIEYETVKSTKSKAIRELRKEVSKKNEEA